MPKINWLAIILPSELILKPFLLSFVKLEEIIWLLPNRIELFSSPILTLFIISTLVKEPLSAIILPCINSSLLLSLNTGVVSNDFSNLK